MSTRLVFGQYVQQKRKTSPPKTKRHNLQDFLFYFAIMASWTLGCVLYQQTFGPEDAGGQLFVWNMAGQLRFSPNGLSDTILEILK